MIIVNTVRGLLVRSGYEFEADGLVYLTWKGCQPLRHARTWRNRGFDFGESILQKLILPHRMIYTGCVFTVRKLEFM